VIPRAMSSLIARSSMRRAISSSTSLWGLRLVGRLVIVAFVEAGGGGCLSSTSRSRSEGSSTGDEDSPWRALDEDGVRPRRGDTESNGRSFLYSVEPDVVAKGIWKKLTASLSCLERNDEIGALLNW
jgi:hypothetical protein